MFGFPKISKMSCFNLFIVYKKGNIITFPNTALRALQRFTLKKKPQLKKSKNSMTIHSDWGRILHDECPEAFTAKPPPTTTASSKYQVGIIDGHLQLMRLDVRMETWECFIRNQFLKPMYEMLDSGCSRVVLCFDDYSNVPAYKSMTQKSRANKFEVKVFGLHEELPPVIPDEPMLYLMNRNFKIKLIEMLCRKIPQVITLEQHQEFILDYKKVVVYAPSLQHPSVTPPVLPKRGVVFPLHASREEGGDRCFFPPQDAPMKQRYHLLVSSPSLMTEMVSMGESDVKFTRYVTMFGNALVHAIDGDYMAIALLYYSRHNIHANNQIFILRQISVFNSSAHRGAEEQAQGGGKKKRKASSSSRLLEDEEESEDEAGGEHALLKKKRAPVKKGWVNMQMLYLVIARAMRQSGCSQAINATTFEMFSDMDAVYTAAFLMLCAGTDFSRNIPLIGPKKIWECLPFVAVPALQALRGGPTINENLLLNVVIGKLYGLNFSKHIDSLAEGPKKKGVRRGRKSAEKKQQQAQEPPLVSAVPSLVTQFSFEQTMQALKCSKLSMTTKDRLPSVDRMQNTIKNLMWVSEYWAMENGHVETPLDGKYGFGKDGQGIMNFQDLIILS